MGLIRRQIILYSCILWSACNHSHPADDGRTAAINAFNHQLDSLKNIQDEGERSAQIRALYGTASPQVRNEECESIILALRKTFFYNNKADTGLFPFFYRLSADRTLSPDNRRQVDMSWCNYYAHVAHDADSASYYLGRLNWHPATANNTLNAECYGLAAQIHQLRGQLREAAASLYKSGSFYEKIGDSVNIAKVNGNLANVYRSMQDYEKSIALRKKALNYFLGKKNEAAAVIAIQGLAADFNDMHQLDSTRKYFTMGEAIFDKGIESPVAEYYLYLSKAGMYVSLQRYDSSVLYFDKAKKILDLFNDEDQNMVFTITSSIAYSHERNVYREAELIQNYIPQIFADENLQLARDAYFSLYNISLTQHIGAPPIDYYLSYDSLKSVLSDNQNREFIAEMESKYESQKKSLTIQVQEKEIQRRKTLNLILILATATLLLTGGFLFARLQLLRSRKEAKLQTQFTLNLLKNTEDERRRIAAELHDGVGHELLSLKNNLQQGVANAETKIDAIINDVRMISRNLHPVMLDQIGLEHSIRYLCDQLMTRGGLFVSAEIDYRNQLSKNDELQLYRIVQESLNNVIKYAGAVAARIDIVTKNDKLVVTIMDNGKGFDVEEKMRTESAFGLNSMIQRGKALGGKITISSSAEGTIIHLEIPIHHEIHSNS